MPLTVNTNIPYGNAGGISIDESGAIPVVTFASDPHGGPETLWFCLRIETLSDKKPIGKIRLIYTHYLNILGGNRKNAHALRPVIKHKGLDWSRLPAGEPIFHPDGQMDIAWTLDIPAPTFTVALCYPYGAPELDRLVADTKHYWTADAIGLSQGGRQLVRLSNDYGKDDGGKRPGMYLISRQHAGETSGGWALDGFMRRLAELGDDAPLAWAVPISNIDGVEQGDYGKDNFPYDLNRAWGAAPMRHETLVIQRDIRRWATRCIPKIGLDFHAPGAVENGGCYTFLPKAERQTQAYRIAAELGDAVAESLTPAYASTEFNRVARYGSRWDSPNFTEYCHTAIGIPGMSFEIPYAICNDTVMTRDDYREAGARIADAVTAWITSA